MAAQRASAGRRKSFLGLTKMWDWLIDSWEWLVAFFGAIDWAMLGAWSLTGCLLIVGTLGAVVPFLPGPLLLFVAAVIHTLLRPESGVSWTGFAILGLLVVIAYGFDFISGALGARWFGASRWGMLGVLIGGIVGMFLGLIGLLIGPLVGGFAFEMLLAKQDMKSAGRSTWGTLVGTGVGLVARVVVSIAMLIVFFVDALGGH